MEGRHPLVGHQDRLRRVLQEDAGRALELEKESVRQLAEVEAALCSLAERTDGASGSCVERPDLASGPVAQNGSDRYPRSRLREAVEGRHARPQGVLPGCFQRTVATNNAEQCNPHANGA